MLAMPVRCPLSIQWRPSAAKTRNGAKCQPREDRESFFAGAVAGNLLRGYVFHVTPRRAVARQRWDSLSLNPSSALSISEFIVRECAKAEAGRACFR